MSREEIQAALDKMPYSVTVVTVGRGGAENAFTASWVCQVAFEPPRIMVVVDSQHYSIEFVTSTKNFTVNLLREGQTKLAGHFAKPSTSEAGKLDEFETRESESGAAILADALAYYDCELVEQITCGDHTIYIGEVQDAGVLGEGEPLTTTSGIRYRHKKAAAS